MHSHPGRTNRMALSPDAPIRLHHYYEQDGTPGGTYMTDPPVFRGKTCRKQALFPVAGHRLTPGSQLPIYIVLRAVRPAPRGSIYGRPLQARH